MASSEFDRSSMAAKGFFKEIYSNLFRIIGQGVDGELDVRSGGCCLSSQRHEDNGLFMFFLGFFISQRRRSVIPVGEWLC
jgi:hypothetical protein